jgi:hypothetical protein
MKTKFKHFVRSFKGKLKSEGLVYCNYNHGLLCVARKYPNFQAEERHHRFGLINTNLKQLYASVTYEYKMDLNNYSKLLIHYTNLSEQRPATHYAIFLKTMWALKKQFPEIDLSVLTKEDILQHEYPVRTVVEAMEAGYLLMISEAKMLSAII